MKKIYFLVLFSCIVSFGNAAIRTIMVGNGGSQFSPASTNAQCGDTIVWSWSAGSHTTTSTTIPNCATPWDMPITSSSTSYSITVPCAGTYSYQCTPHASMGMVGNIIVTCSAGITSFNRNNFFEVYPNPFTSRLTIETTDADMLCLYNALGEMIKNIPLQPGQNKTEVNAGDLPAGIYFYGILKEAIIIGTKKIIKE